MRVIAGTAGSLPLKTLPGLSTRPTQDRIKETLFNILQPDIPGCRFLDLFAGSGAMGIEALSRGAVFAAFVEKNAAASRIIRENLHFTGLEDRALNLCTDAVSGLKTQKIIREAPYDIVFMDPPYGTGEGEKALQALLKSPAVSPETIIILEESIRFDPSVILEMPFEITRDKRYKTNRHLFMRLKKETT